MSQYNKNTEVLKNFFKKPLTLVLSILFFVSAVIPCIYIIVKLIISGESNNLAICIYPTLMILPAVAYLNLFIQGRKITEINRLNTPLILIYMYTVLCILESLSFFTYYMLSYFTEKNEFAFIFVGIFILIIIVPAIILTLLFISMIITFHSIRKSANGIYLLRKGSVFMSVTSFTFSAVMILIMVYFFKGIEFSDLLNYNQMFDCVILMLEGAVVTTLFICLGIWALMYSSTINNAAVCLHGTNKKSVIKAQTLADTLMTTQTEFSVDKIQSAADYVNQQTFGNGDSRFPAVTENQKPEIFTLPEQDEPNPYGNKKSIRKQDKSEETLNHINYQNPYENFTPQNPFE